MKATRVSNSLDPDQDRHSVGQDLGPNCLQRLSVDTKSLHAVVVFFKITFSKKSFRNTIRVSNSLDPDQDGPLLYGILHCHDDM